MIKLNTSSTKTKAKATASSLKANNLKASSSMVDSKPMGSTAKVAMGPAITKEDISKHTVSLLLRGYYFGI